MNPFSVVSHIQSNLPSLPTSLLQRRKSAAVTVNVVVQTSPASKTTTTTSRLTPLPPHAPTTTTILEQQQEDEKELTEQQPPAVVVATVVPPNKPRNNPQAILDNFIACPTEAEMEPTMDSSEFRTDLGPKNLHRHSIHAIPVSSSAAEESNLQRIALRRHTSFPTVQSALSTDNGIPERAASLDGYDRAKVLKSSPYDAIQSTTMISQPRQSHLRHTRSSSHPPSLIASTQSPRSPATVPTPHSPALQANIPAVNSSMVESEDDSEEEDSEEDSEESSEEDSDGTEEHPADHHQSSQSRSHIGSVRDLLAFASSPAAAHLGKEPVIVTPPASPSLNAAATSTTGAKASSTKAAAVPAPIVVIAPPAPLSPPTSLPPSPSSKKTMFTPAPIMVVSHQNSSSIPPSSPIHSVTYVSPSTSSTTTTSKTTTTTTTTTTTAAATAATTLAPVSSPVSIAPPSPVTTSVSTAAAAPAAPTPAVVVPPVSSTPSAASSFLSAWQGRSRAMIPTLPRPSHMMPFHAARKVVSSVTTAGTGLLPTKEQLNSIPVAGRILSHPVMDSTLSYIAEKASERGISLHALTGGIDPRKLIRPEDVPYRKLNKTMIHQAMTLSVLAVQKEELSKAMDDEDGDDAFELYLAAVNTLLHSLPFETCDPLRREAFETQLRSFLDDQLCQKDDNYDLSETAGSNSKKLRRRRRRRHRQHHDQATSLIHQHTLETTAEPTTSQGHQRRQHIRQKNLQREQHIKQQQLMAQQQALEKQHQQEQKEKRRQEKNVVAAASQKQSGKVSLSAAQDRSSSSASKKTKRSSRRRHAAQYPQQQHPEGYNDNMNGSINNGGGLGDTIISTAVHGAIRLKQSPIPDVVKSCLRTSKIIFHKVDERFHLQDKAWEMSKNGIEKAIELDEQYAIHEVVTETVFATLTGLVKAGIAYKESPSYAAVRAAASDNGKIAAAPQVEVLESASSSRSHHPQGAQPTSTRKSDHKSKKAALKEKEKEKAAAAAAAVASARSSITSRWTRRPQSVVVESEASSDSEEDSEDSDSSSDSDSEVEQKPYRKNSKSNHKIAPSSSSSSAFSSASSSSCSSTAGSGADNSDDSGDSDNETVELNRETLRPSAPASGRGGAAYHQHHQDTSKLPPPPPYSEQVREKIDMFMALKGAASLLVGSL